MPKDKRKSKVLQAGETPLSSLEKSQDEKLQEDEKLQADEKLQEDSSSMGQLMSAIKHLQQSMDEIRGETNANRRELSDLRKQLGQEDDHESVHSIEDEDEEENFLRPASETLKLYDLPKFAGSAEQWPLFYASFVDTTKAFKYTNRHNLIRLQKCLVEEAKETVESLLIYPADVPAALEELEFRYGRPELLVRSQLDRIQQFEKITEKNIDNLVALSSLVRNIVGFLSSANCEHHISNPTLLDQLIYKLPPSKQFEWGRYAITLKSYPTIREFSIWLSEIAKIVCILPQLPSQPKAEKAKNTSQPSTGSARRVMHAQNSETPSGQQESRQEKCFECSGSHFIGKCDMFINQRSVQERWAKVKQQNLCFSCLRKGHSVSQCRSKKSCGINGCRKNHHKLLHETESQPTSRPVQQELVHPEPVLQVLRCSLPSSPFLFKLASITVLGPKGQISIYALIDEGSSVSMLDADIAQQLGLKGKKQPLTLQWYDDEVVTKDSTVLDVNIKTESGENFEVKNVHAIGKMSLPTQSFKKSDFRHFECLPISDYSNVQPLMLLGLNCAYLTASSTLVSASASEPVAAMTKLGWVVYGPTCQNSFANSPVLFARSEPSFKSLDRAVSEFFNTENFGAEISLPPLEAADEARARQILTETTRYIGDRYEVGLLWKSDSPILPDSYAMAAKRLKGIESKMRNDVEFAARYSAEMNKYIEKGYARKLTPEEVENTTQPLWYLPHFAAQNPHKPGKMRIVFDAAATVGQQSLNSALLKGPEQAKPLLGILFKFRQGRIAVAADVREMFSQIKIRSADQNAQRFLWRENNALPIQQYSMTSMIFGAVSSPCCAEHVKNINAENFRDEYPEAVTAIIEKFYVDDFVCSFPEEQHALEICQQVVRVNANAGFELRNFSSNSLSLQNAMNQNETADAIYLDRQSQTEKILGMYWCVAQDSFQFLTKFHRIPQEVVDSKRPPTKRELLAIIMAIFDPYGMLANFLLFAKVLLQNTWKAKLDWDDLLPPALSQKWFLWWHEFATISSLNVPRCYSSHLYNANNIQLHVFMDASEEAFSAVAYLRIEHQNVEVAFVCGKTRVAPQKLLSMPRLELQAAVLSTRLSKAVVDNHEIVISSKTFWTDSKTVLNWIYSKNRRFKPFVGHRVAEILSSTEEEQWRWVPTSLNPADAATRTKKGPAIKHDIWLKGPNFLYQPEDTWPTATFSFCAAETYEEEIKSTHVLQIQASENLINFNRFSSLYRLKRSVAWVLRACSRFRAKKRAAGNAITTNVALVPPLLPSEINKAENLLVKLVQEECFAAEKDQISRQQAINKKSQLYKLTPYIDKDDLMRASGRLDEALYLPEDVRRPLILPKKHYLSKLIMAHYHEAYHHQNQAVILNAVRQKFWIVGAKPLLKAVQRSCMTCRLENAKPTPPLMGQLPTDRITPYVRPFSYTGVDLFGPLQVTVGRRREKRWAVIYTCLTVRAVHIELVDSLSTDAFLVCFHSFINRRGTPVRMRSDNGTNFIGAQKELHADKRQLDVDRIQEDATKFGVEWVFNCPLNPSAGGCWERLIRIVKRLLCKTVQNDAPKEETLRAALIEAENIVNSRPLTDVPLLHSEQDPLTPNHFLLGCANTTQTRYNDVVPVSLRKQWHILQDLKRRLWKQWTVEFLPQLLRRPKWCEDVTPLKVGDFVIVCDSTLPRGQWLKGRITEVHQSKTGQVRSAKVQTKNGIMTRPATKLAALMIGEPDQDSPGGGMLC